MAKYHINDSGNPGLCRAKKGRCPFGADDEHYSNRIEAMQAYSKDMEVKSRFMRLTKKKPNEMKGSSSFSPPETGPVKFQEELLDNTEYYQDAAADLSQAWRDEKLLHVSPELLSKTELQTANDDTITEAIGEGKSIRAFMTRDILESLGPDPSSFNKQLMIELHGRDIRK
jgi:hypothetical protein